MHRNSVEASSSGLGYLISMTSVPSQAPESKKAESRFLSGIGLTLFSLAVFAATTLGSYVAQHGGKRVSAALIYVIGVTVIGSFAGLRSGLIAAIGASAIYNFFLSDPVLQFGATSFDELTPLIAFNVAAILSGVLAGRLKDRANAAEEAQARIRLLLAVSGRLQNALRLEEVGNALKDIGPPWLEGSEIFDQRGNQLGNGGQPARFGKIAFATARNPGLKHEIDGHIVYRLAASSGDVGVIVFDGDPRTIRNAPVDIEALVNLLTMAMERCQLLEQQAQVEAVRRSEKFKTAILASLSHDMRTPLAAISASASSLASFADALDRQTHQQLLRTIEEQCQRLDRYTANLLDLGQLEAGITSEQRSAVDALELLGAAIRNARTDESDHVIDKAFSCDSAIVVGNAVMMEQLFFNVIENAIHYSPSGSLILITAAITDEVVRIGVMDEGCGIPHDELSRIFERFYRSSRTQRHEGQGLGLSIAKGFVEAFGGTIRAESPHSGGFGTHIIIELPLAKNQGVNPTNG